MKAYTDLEQSKKLAEILPLESADMHYNVVGDVAMGDYQRGTSGARSVAKAWKKNPDEFAQKVIPCWSLAALLDIIPQVNLDAIKDDDKNYWILWSHPSSEIVYRTNKFYENPIDACVEMVLKFHEQNIL